MTGDLAGSAGALRLYAAVAARGWRRRSRYRLANVAGSFTNALFGFFHSYVLLAVWAGHPQAGGWDRRDALTYVWVAQGALTVVGMWGWHDLAERIRSGDIAVDLQRPADLLTWWLADDLGRAAFFALTRLVPQYGLGVLLFAIVIPGPATAAALAVSLGLGALVSFAVRFLANGAAFWLFDHRGVTALVTVFATFFSGMIVPVVLMPVWLQTIAYALPFAAMVQTPVDVVLAASGGPGASVPALLSGQAAWALCLLALGWGMVRMGRRRVVIQGG